MPLEVISLAIYTPRGTPTKEMGSSPLTCLLKKNAAVEIAYNKCYVTFDTTNLKTINHRIWIKNNFRLLNCWSKNVCHLQ